VLKSAVTFLKDKIIPECFVVDDLRLTIPIADLLEVGIGTG
jgi:hypothetical protein